MQSTLMVSITASIALTQRVYVILMHQLYMTKINMKLFILVIKVFLLLYYPANAIIDQKAIDKITIIALTYYNYWYNVIEKKIIFQ